MECASDSNFILAVCRTFTSLPNFDPVTPHDNPIIALGHPPGQTFCCALYILHLERNWDEGWRGLGWLGESCNPFLSFLPMANARSNSSLNHALSQEVGRIHAGKENKGVPILGKKYACSKEGFAPDGNEEMQPWQPEGKHWNKCDIERKEKQRRQRKFSLDQLRKGGHIGSEEPCIPSTTELQKEDSNGDLEGFGSTQLHNLAVISIRVFNSTPSVYWRVGGQVPIFKTGQGCAQYSRSHQHPKGWCEETTFALMSLQRSATAAVPPPTAVQASCLHRT
eukprot:1156275-Pelagomonas_calceolata.AAC.2